MEQIEELIHEAFSHSQYTFKVSTLPYNPQFVVPRYSAMRHYNGKYVPQND